MEFEALQVGGPVDEVVVHCGDEMEQLLLEDLDAVHELAEHHLVLEVEPLPCPHIFDFVLVIFRITVAFGASL